MGIEGSLSDENLSLELDIFEYIPQSSPWGCPRGKQGELDRTRGRGSGGILAVHISIIQNRIQPLMSPFSFLLSDFLTFSFLLSDFLTFKLLTYQTIILSNYQLIKLLTYQTINLSNYQLIKLSTLEVILAYIN